MLSRISSESAGVRGGSESALRIVGGKPGDLLEAHYRKGDGETSLRIQYYSEGDKELPEGTMSVKVKHVACSGEPISVDLV